MTSGEGTKFVPFDVAKHIVRQQGIKSRTQYWKWHRNNNIQYMPRYPNRVYTNWEGWNLFLGQNNSFDQMIAQGIEYRPFWEAVRWAQAAAKKHNLTSRNEWIQFHRDGNVPHDIPRYPDHVYDQFVGKGWTVWLAQNIGAKLMSERQNIGLFSIMAYNTNAQPANMIVAKLFKNGESEGLEYLQAHPDLKVLRAFKWDPDRSDVVKQIFDSLASDQGDNNYLVNNLNDLLFELSAELEPWQR